MYDCPFLLENRFRSTETFWNGFNKVSQDHWHGDVDEQLTNMERKIRGFTVPWYPELVDKDIQKELDNIDGILARPRVDLDKNSLDEKMMWAIAQSEYFNTRFF